MKKLFASVLLVVLLAQLTGCGSPAPAPTSTPLQTNTPVPIPTDTPFPSPTLEPAPVVPAEIVDEIDQELVDMNTKGELNGIVLVAKDGNVLLHKAYGMADHKMNIPLKEDTLMPLLTFHLEAAAILLLDHQGKLSLEDPICKYLPDCPENWNAITINNILYHSWGIPTDAFWANIRSQVDWWEFWLSPTRYERIISEIGGKPINPIVPPADAFMNFINYPLQDKIIEQVSGVPPGEYINKNILEPLGITHLGKSYTKDEVAVGHAQYVKNRSTEPYPDNALFPYFPVSTVEDLYKLSQEYLDPKALPIEVVDGLRKEIKYSNGQGIDLADLIGDRKRQGWVAYPRINGKGSLNWWLYNMGYSGAQFISFEDQVVIIIFTNEASRDYIYLLQSIYEKLTAD